MSEKSASSGKTGDYDALNTPTVLVHITNPEWVPASRWKDHFKDQCKGEHSAAKRLRAGYHIVLPARECQLYPEHAARCVCISRVFVVGRGLAFF